MANRDDDFLDDFDDDDGFDDRFEPADEGGSSRGPLIIAAIVLLVSLFGFVVYTLTFGSNKNNVETVAADTNVTAALDPALDPNAIGADATNSTGAGTGNDASVMDLNADAPPLQVEPLDGAEDPIAANPAPAVAAPAPRPATVAPATVAPTPRPATTAARPATVAAAPRPATPVARTPAATVTQTAPPRIATATPAARPATAAAPRPATPAPATVAATTGAHRFSAQLGSFQDRASADRQLAAYRASGLSAGNNGSVSIVAANLGARGTWYRIRASGFDSRAEAVAFCEAAHGAGAPCIPASN